MFNEEIGRKGIKSTGSWVMVSRKVTAESRRDKEKT